MSVDEAAIGFGSAAPRMMIPYSVSRPRTFKMAIESTLSVPTANQGEPRRRLAEPRASS